MCVCPCEHAVELQEAKQHTITIPSGCRAEVVNGNASVKKARRGEVQMSGSYRQSLSRSHSGSLTRKKKKEGKRGARGQGAGRQSIFQGACERIQ